jgi:hypothetical protein
MSEPTVWLVTTRNGTFRGVFSTQANAWAYIDQVHATRRRVLEYTVREVYLDKGKDIP